MQESGGGVRTLTIEGELERRLEQAREREDARERLRRRIRAERRILVPMLGLTLLAWPNFGTARVIGQSMEPTYRTGNTLVVLKTYRWLSPLKVGDVVVVRMKHSKIAGEDIVKRVAFIQNEKGDKPLPPTMHTVKGEVATEELFPDQISGRARTPAGTILVMGDNLPKSMDSRDFGPVEDSEIIGKVIHQY